MPAFSSNLVNAFMIKSSVHLYVVVWLKNIEGLFGRLFHTFGGKINSNTIL